MSHNRSNTRLYKVWTAIKQRCYNLNDKNFKSYGGRGIAMNASWRNDFRAFADYIDNALGARPTGYSLDRINNNGNYEPGNLRWADRGTQTANRRPFKVSFENGRRRWVDVSAIQ